ncbi:hypothetical protein BC829DRAFT_393441, partial [Chytridium lagenaria]
MRWRPRASFSKPIMALVRQRRPRISILVMTTLFFLGLRFAFSSVISSPDTFPESSVAVEAEGDVRVLEALTDPNTRTIPKKIWTYFPNDTDIPVFVKSCVIGWRRLNPDHQVKLLTPKTVWDFVTSEPPHRFATLPSSLQMDWFRLALINEHGGIWVDPYLILTQPLHFLHNLQQRERGLGSFAFHYSEFTFNTRVPSIEPWFLGAFPRDPWVNAWFDEFTTSLGFEKDVGYMLYLREQHGIETFQKIRSAGDRILSSPRLFLSCQKVFVVDEVYPPHVLPADEEILLPGLSRSEEAFLQPLYFLQSVNFDEKMAAKALLDEYYTDENSVPVLIRLREGDWKALEVLLKFKPLISETSLYIRYINCQSRAFFLY